MASSIVFTDGAGSVKVQWNDGTAKAVYMQKEDYNLFRSGSNFRLIPNGVGLTDIGQFSNSDLTTPYADADALEAAVAAMFEAPTVVIDGGVTVTGMSTAAKQDVQSTKLDEIKTKQDTANLALDETKINTEATAENVATTNARLGADETGTTLRGRIKTWYDAAIAFFSAITNIIVSGKLNTRAAETDALIGLGDGSVSASVNGYLKNTANPTSESYVDTFDNGSLIGIVTRNSTTGAISRSFYRAESMAPYTPSTDPVLVNFEILTRIGKGDGTDSQSMNGRLEVLTAATESTITQLTATGQSPTLTVSGKTGSFIYSFVKNGGTSGIISLQASNDGVIWKSIAATASLTADDIGTLTWAVPYKQVRIDFAQTGAGSTVDGTFFAVRS